MKQATYILSPQSERDLDEIWDYTYDAWNVERADSYVAEIHLTFALLAKNPNLGRDYAHVRKNYRRYPTGSHTIFYRVNNKEIIVMRILHQRMEPERYL